MAALPLVVSLVVGAALAPALLRALRTSGWTGLNYRSRSLPRPTGLLLVLAPGLTLAALGLLDGLSGVDLVPDGLVEATAFVAGVALLGLVDDLAGGGDGPRGVRGHLLGTLGERPSTGALKAGGTAALALAVVFAPGSALARGEVGETLLAAATLTLAPHVFNLLDLRPARALKTLVLMGAVLTLAARDLDPVVRLGAFLGPTLVLLPIDARERGMLGDTGASALGAVAGLWIVLALPPLWQGIALAAGVASAAYGELRSITALVERNPLLRQLDSLGRCG